MGKLTETELKDFLDNNKVSVSSNGVCIVVIRKD